MHSARPSSRSSIRSTGSIGSFGNRRASSGGLTGAAGGGGGVGHSSGGGGGGGGGPGGSGSKGILVSTSRTGAARSAAILLISCHITAVSKQNSRASSRHTSGAGCSQHSRDNLDENNGCNGSGSGGAGGGGSDGGCRSCESTLSMNRQLQKQLNHQRHLLSFELSPAKTKNQDRFRTLLGMNGIHNYDDDDDNNDDDGFNSIGGGGGGGGSGSGVGVGVDYGSGIGGGAELHHLQIGALPTPASETPRFAVNQLISQQSFSVNHQHQHRHRHRHQSLTITIGQFVAFIPHSNYVFSL